MDSHMGVSENKGYLVSGPYNKDPTVSGTCFRVPHFRKLPHRHLDCLGPGAWVVVYQRCRRIFGLRRLYWVFIGLRVRLWACRFVPKGAGLELGFEAEKVPVYLNT